MSKPQRASQFKAFLLELFECYYVNLDTDDDNILQVLEQLMTTEPMDEVYWLVDEFANGFWQEGYEAAEEDYETGVRKPG